MPGCFLLLGVRESLRGDGCEVMHELQFQEPGGRGIRIGAHDLAEVLVEGKDSGGRSWGGS